MDIGNYRELKREGLARFQIIDGTTFLVVTQFTPAGKRRPPEVGAFDPAQLKKRRAQIAAELEAIDEMLADHESAASAANAPGNSRAG